MKYLVILYATLLISSCCSAKQVTQQNPEIKTTPNTKVETPKKTTEPRSEEIQAVDVQIDYVDGKNPNSDDSDVYKIQKIDRPIEIAAPPQGQEKPETDKGVEDNISEAFNHDVWDALLQKHVSEQGLVNYKGFIADKKEFISYLNALSENPPQAAWTKDDVLAYWMNVYNAFTIKLILDNYPTKSIKDIDGPWGQRFIKIGEKWYTLNDVEHKIIRKMDEPRIHFALVCAAISCPRLYNKAFTATNLESSLSTLTYGFLSDPTKNNLSENSIALSKIFKWYGGDFNNNGSSLIDFLNQYSDVSISSSAKKSYKDYNWALNE